jgi:DNA-binding response OmpR family regulator
MSSILVVDDDPLVARFIERGLRSAGHATTVAHDAPTALSLACGSAYDLVLLDIVLADGDGFTVLRELRTRRRSLPVLVMTAHPTLRDVVSCLDGGADDYLVKPFRFAELLARVNARLRAPGPPTTNLRHGDLALDLHSRRATAAGSPVELTHREFALLETLLRHPGQVLSHTYLHTRVWGHQPGPNTLPVCIAALRQKIGTHRIATIRGTGYRLTPNPAPGA